MISSQIDSSIGKREFELLSDQDHMEEVWAVMQPRLEEYANNYLEGARITERLNKLKVVFEKLYSDKSIEKWNAGELQVGLIHSASAGHGLNLQSGGNVIV